MLKVRRVVLYKHGVGYFERRGKVTGDEVVHLDFKARDMNDVLKSMTVLDLGAGTVSAVGYDSTKPLEKLLEEATIRLPESGALTALLGQVKGARIRAKVGTKTIEGTIVGMETVQIAAGETSIPRVHLALLFEGAVRTYDLLELEEIAFLDETVRKDVEFYLATVLSSYKKDTKRVQIFTAGDGSRELFVSYTLETPVWKTSYRILLDDEGKPTLQGWAVVDNVGDDDWEDVDLALIAGLPVSFVHDLYSPRYISRPIVHVETEGAAAPVIPEEAYGGMVADAMSIDEMDAEESAAPRDRAKMKKEAGGRMMPKGAAAPAPISGKRREEAMARSAQVQTIVKDVGDLFEYRVANPVTVRRNQSALVPILHRKMEGRRVLLWNRATREKNPMAAIELTNGSELTLEGGPATVTEGDLYVGEAMLDTMKPADRRFVPYAVELGCVVSIDDKSDTGSIFRATLAHGTLTTWYWQYRRTHVRIKSKAKKPQTFYLEHPKTHAWELVETAKPFEETDRFHRFKLALEPGQEQTFVISERYQGYSSYSIQTASKEDLAFYLSSKWIDERIAEGIKGIIALRSDAAKLQEQATKLEAEREKIFGDQERIRENLEALKGGGAEQKQHIERLVKKLSTQEDRLEKIQTEIEKLEAEEEKLEVEIAARIEKLQFTAELGEKPKK